MAKIAILGFGTVGSGVYEVLCRNAAGVSRRAGEPVEVKYILDPKDFSNHPDAHLFIKNFDTILEDPEIKVVVETIGGTRFAYPYVKACLESGRSVCTSNKEMVATYGAELLGLAKEHGCAFLFEASVGGGTPIITPMHQVRMFCPACRWVPSSTGWRIIWPVPSAAPCRPTRRQPTLPPKQMEDTIIKLLEQWQKKRQHSEER